MSDSRTAPEDDDRDDGVDDDDDGEARDHGARNRVRGVAYLFAEDRDSRVTRKGDEEDPGSGDKAGTARGVKSDRGRPGNGRRRHREDSQHREDERHEHRGHAHGLHDAPEVEAECHDDGHEPHDALVARPGIRADGERSGARGGGLAEDKGIAREHSRRAREVGPAVGIGTAGFREDACEGCGRRRIERRDRRGDRQCNEQSRSRKGDRGSPRREDTGAEHGSQSDDGGSPHPEDASQLSHDHSTVGTISPAGSPPPRSTCRDCCAMTSLSTPIERRMPAIATGRARPEPSSILSATERPSARTTR